MTSQIEIIMCEIINTDLPNRIAYNEEIRLWNYTGCGVDFKRILLRIVYMDLFNTLT